MYGPNIPHYACVFGNRIPHVFIVADHGVRDTKDGSGHPAHTFFYAAADIRQIWRIVQCRETIAAYAVELFAGSFCNLWEENHCLNDFWVYESV